MRLVNFIIKHPFSVFLFLPILYGILKLVFSQIEYKVVNFFIDYLYFNTSDVIFTAVYSMFYAYVLFLYQLKRIDKSFIYLVVLSVLGMFVFVLKDLSIESLCVLFAINFIYMGVAKNRLDIWYEVVVFVFGFISLVAVAHLEDWLIPSLISYSLDVSIFLYATRLFSSLFPAFLFVYFVVKLRGNHRFNIYPLIALFLLCISLLPIVILDLNSGRDAFFILFIVFGGFSVFNFFSMIALFLSEPKTLTKGVKKLFVFDVVGVLIFTTFVHIVFGRDIVGTLVFCIYSSMIVLTPFNAIVLETIGSKNKFKFSSWTFFAIMLGIEIVCFIASFYIFSNLSKFDISIDIRTNVALSLLGYTVVFIYFLKTAKKGFK